MDFTKFLIHKGPAKTFVKFARAVSPLIEKAGGEVLLSVEAVIPVVSEDLWDHFTLTRYPSMDAYSPEYYWLDDVAVVSRSKHGHLRVHSTWAQDESGSAGLGWGAVTGGLIGLQAGPGGALAGAAVGGSIGGLDWGADRTARGHYFRRPEAG